MNFSHLASALRIIVLAFLLTLTLSPALLAAPPSGGGSKITVTAANPSEAAQGEEVDVIVTGSGFDSGSQVSYLVTGTTDGSQVDVISVEFISSTQLKTRIRPKDAALATAYDIEVRTLSGRKGKGTTLFRVKLADGPCVGNTEIAPAHLYLTETELLTIGTGKNSSQLYTRDLKLVSASGCNSYLLVDDAAQWLPDSRKYSGQNRFIKNVSKPAVAIRDGQGVATWIDDYKTPWALMVLEFEFGPETGLQASPLGPQTWSSPIGWNVIEQDVALMPDGEIHVAMVERFFGEVEIGARRISALNYSSSDFEVVVDGNCHVQDQLANCYVPDFAEQIVWNPTGTAIYFDGVNSFEGQDKRAIARIARLNGAWQPAEFLLGGSYDSGPRNPSVSVDGIMAFTYYGDGSGSPGPDLRIGLLDADHCAEFGCVTAEGAVGTVRLGGSPSWSRSGSLLFIRSNTIGEFLDPLRAVESSLSVGGVHDFDADQ